MKNWEQPEDMTDEEYDITITLLLLPHNGY